MRDAYKIKGEKITFKNKLWEIGEVHFVPSNPNLYVELKDGSVTMNVILEEITDLIVSRNKIKQVMSDTV